MRRGMGATVAVSLLFAASSVLAQAETPAKKAVQVAQGQGAGTAGGAAGGAAATTTGVAGGITAGTAAAAFGAAVAAIAVAGGGGETVSHFATTHNPSK